MAQILIVDDNLMIRTLLREILEGGGHEVVGEADNGLEAPALARDLNPDLTTLDLVMPGRDGLTTLQHLQMIDPAMSVIVCSASLDQAKVVAALKLGAKAFIVKPFNREKVLDTVGDALRQPGGDLPDVATDRREFARAKQELPVVAVLDDAGAQLDTFTIDLGGSGMLLAEGSLALDAKVRFRLQLGGGETPIEGSGRVVRVADEAGPALAFENMSVDDHERLIRYIDTH